MARRPFFWVCPCCFDKKRGEAGTYICLRCSEDMGTLRNIYTLIVARFPALDKETMAAVFRRLWLRFEKENPKGKKPTQPRDPELFSCSRPVESCIGEHREALTEEVF